MTPCDSPVTVTTTTVTVTTTTSSLNIVHVAMSTQELNKGS
ncbi:unnamed protein product [Schistocephalus solidus]|uniref:Uncharacterized protein n=1 Tax=Schistocephalus solidus TaxID=70667 RepID=A0A3P7DFW1_SCHSO|nr:unnamed protein product [Schistocephalus solidus]